MRVSADPKIKTRVADMGGTVLAGSPGRAFGKLIADETEKWAVQLQSSSRRQPGLIR